MNKNFDTQQIFGFVVSLAFWWLILGNIQVAVGLVALVFVHEMGHFMAAKWRGVEVTMPTFTPMGAYVMTGPSASVAEEAYIKLAGPLVGGVASLLTLAAGYAVGSAVMTQVGMLGVFLNLFNMIPLDPFDGGGIAQTFGRWTVVPGVIAFVYFFLTLGGGSTINLLFGAFFAYQCWLAYQQRTMQWQSRPHYFRTSAAAKASVAVGYLATGGILAYVLLHPSLVPALLTQIGL
jgi:Zn-dependent protease